MNGREDGVSSVVSAVLLVALFTTAMTIWTFTTLPTWVAQREANHQGEAQESFGRLKGDLDSLVAQGESGPVATAFDLGPSRVPLLQGRAAQGTLSIQDGFAVQGAFTTAKLLLQDGAAIGVPSQPAALPAVADVHAVEALSLRISTGSVGGGNEAWVQVSATDGTDTVVGALVHMDDAAAVGCSGSGLVLRITTTLAGPPASVSTRSVPLLCQVGSTVPEYTLDLLAQPLYNLALRDLAEDMTFTFTTGKDATPAAMTVSGWYAMVWTDTIGRDLARGAGVTSSYVLDAEGGRLVLDPRYQRFPSQVLAFDGGAIVAAQGDRQVMLADPGFDLSIDGGIGTLRWTIVDLAGSGSRTGSDAAAATLRNDASSDLLLEMEAATFTVTSDYAAAWRQMFEDRALLAGTTAAVTTVGGTGDTATLALQADGDTVTTWIVRLHVVDATATIA